MYVLRLPVIDKQSAVAVPALNIEVVLEQQLTEQLGTDFPEVAGDNQVKVARLVVCVSQVVFDDLRRGRRHRRTHVVRVRYA